MLKYSSNLLASFFNKFKLLISIVFHIVTVSFAGCALFLLGFYVIPVFAEKVPQVVSDISTTQENLSIGKDSDGDGLSDTWERKIGSETFLSDTDGDGLPDGLEVNLKKKKH